LEAILATLDTLRISKAWDLKCVPIEIKHSDAGGCPATKLTIRAFVHRDDWLVDVKVVKKGPRMVSSFSKDNLVGNAFAKEAYMQTLIPQVHSNSVGVYHGDGLNPASLTKPP
jgi:hypothetical protein